MAIEKITIVGSGNIAAGLGAFFKAIDLEIVQLCSRNKKTGQALAKKLNTTFIDSTEKLKFHAGIFLLAVPDDSIQLVAEGLSNRIKKNGKVLHCSGGTASTILKKSCTSYGVFYPLQTFTKGRRLKRKGIPFCVVANKKSLVKKLLELGEKISGSAFEISDAERLNLHVAAVMVNNFTNHLLVLSKDFLEEKNLSFEMLHPLIKETIQKALLKSPEQSQTGPAKRGDKKTIERHLKILKKEENLKKLYLQLSDNISDYYKN